MSRPQSRTNPILDQKPAGCRQTEPDKRYYSDHGHHGERDTRSATAPESARGRKLDEVTTGKLRIGAGRGSLHRGLGVSGLIGVCFWQRIRNGADEEGRDKVNDGS